MADAPFTDPREAARALFVARADLDWLSGLLDKAGLPPLAEGGAL